MIVDIVQLPRRMKQFKHSDASITSEKVMGFPISGIYRVYGYCDYDDSLCFGVGGKHRLITGTDALFRYKFIEPTKYGIAEYFCMTSSPIDIRSPLRNRRTKIYCPWVTITDARTLRVRKFILWSSIFQLMHYETEDSVYDTPVEAVIANEIRNFAAVNDRLDIAQSVSKYPSNFKNVLISEEKIQSDDALDKLATLTANIRAYNEMTDGDNLPFYWCDASDIFRGVDLPAVWTDASILKSCTLLPHFIYGPTTIGEISHLFGMSYDTHAFQRVFNERDLSPYTEISIYGDDDRNLFNVLKNCERLPYSEFAITIDEDGSYSTTLYNQYDPYMAFPTSCNKEEVESKYVSNIVSSIKLGFKNLKRATIVRSWSEEIYITIRNTDGSTDRFYFDLVSASLGTRSLIRDYSGGMV